jgi:flagellar hook-length control protein FliK
LQSAQQSQPHASQDASHVDSQNNHPRQDDNSAQNSGAQASDASSHANKPGADAKDSQSDTANDNGPGIDLTGGVGTLVGAVLSLIDHATGDTHAGAAGTTRQNTGNKQPPAVAQPTAPAAAMMPVPLPAITPVAMPVGSNTATLQTGSVLSGIGSGLSSKADLKADDGFSASDATTAVASTSTDASSFTQALGDSAQALANSVAATGRAALPAAAAFTTDNSSSSTSGITALGSLTATAPVMAADTPATHNLAMDAPVGSSGFAKELGQQITWLSGQDVKQAQIRLHPQDLGPLDVKVSVEHGRVDVNFLTQHPDTTAAVQQSLGQLHQMLGGQGLSLGHATVGQHAQQQFGGRPNQQAQTGNNAGDDIADTPIATAARVAIGLVDAFA